MTDRLDDIKAALAHRREHGVFPSRQTWGETDDWLRALVAEVEALRVASASWKQIADEAAEKLHALRQRHAAIQAVVGRQAEDEALWLPTADVTNAYLQAALRELHRIIEGGGA